LRIRTHGIGDNDRFTPKGQNLVVELVGVAQPDSPYARGEPIDGVSSVTIHCDGRDKPITAVLVIQGVLLELDGLELPEAASAALRLLKGA
jgi:hypothetical protein